MREDRGGPLWVGICKCAGNQWVAPSCGRVNGHDRVGRSAKPGHECNAVLPRAGSQPHSKVTFAHTMEAAPCCQPYSPLAQADLGDSNIGQAGVVPGRATNLGGSGGSGRLALAQTP